MHRSKLTLPLLLCLLLLLPVKSQAQQLKQNHQLLWRISGNGLQEHSYLYGTMHLQDERVFDFSDSVLLKLDACKAFALEVDPDSMVYYLFKDLYGLENNSTNKIRESLSSKEYDALAARFKEKTGFALDQVNQSDPAFILELMEGGEIGAKDHATFLDAYLYDLALKRGKNITSLENVKDQLDALHYRSPQELKEKLLALTKEDDKNEQELLKQYSEEFIKLYHSGDLEGLWKYISGMSETEAGGTAFMDKVLIRRNHGMHKRLLEQLRRESTFVAVGAAHLPGEEGLIALLRKSGFTVEAVPAVFSNKAQQQRRAFEKGDLNWQVFRHEKMGYSVELPRQPFELLTGKFPMPVYFYPEIGAGLYYMTMAYNSGYKTKTDAQILRLVAENMQTEMGSIFRKKDISTKGMAGLESYFKNASGGYLRSQLFVKGGMIYLLMAMANVSEVLEGAHAQRFFRSFKPEELANLSLQKFISKEGAFAIDMPGSPSYQFQHVADPNNPDYVYKTHLYTLQNPKTGTFYLVRYNNMPKGMILQDCRKESLSGMAHSIASNAGASISKESMEEGGGFPVYSFEFSKDEFLGTAQIIARGNRMYLLMAFGATNTPDRQEISQFLSSFEFLPFEQEEMQVYEHADFSVLFPTQEVHQEGIDMEDYYSHSLAVQSKMFSSTSELSGNVFSVNQEKVSRYFTVGTDSGFYRLIHEHLLDTEDSLIWQREVEYEGVPALALLVKNKYAPNFKRGLLLPTSDHLYTLWAIVAPGHEEGEQTEQFLKSFRLKERPTPSLLFRNNEMATAALLNDLLAQDSTTVKLAGMALAQQILDSSYQEHIMQVYEKLGSPGSLRAAESKPLLVDQLTSMPGPETVAFLEKQYKLLPDTAWHRTELLRALAGMDFEAGLLKAKELLLQNPPLVAENQYFTVFSDLKYSNKKHLHLLFPEVFELIHRPATAREALDLMVLALDSAYVEASLIEAKAEHLDKLGLDCLEGFLRGSEEDDLFYQNYFWPLQNYVRLLGKLSLTPAREAAMRQLLNAEQAYMRLQALGVLLAHDKSVEAAPFEQLAANKDFRLSLYELLKEHRKLQLFPKKYRNQAMMAEAVFAQLLEYSDEYPTEVTLLKKLKVAHEGKKGWVYVYKCRYEYEESTYETLGYAGIFSLKKGEFEVVKDISQLYHEEMPAKADIDRVVKELVATYISY